MNRWEYRFIVEEKESEIDSFVERMNAFGYDGWELVNVIPETSRNYLSAVFKRPLPDKN
ncbi:MAG: hypothetical protein ACLFQK_08125 [Fibrobacterota bacterium]